MTNRKLMVNSRKLIANMKNGMDKLARTQWEIDVNELRRHRFAKGWTQVRLAKLLGVSISAISDWESGKRKPHPKNFMKMSRLYGVDPLAFTRVVAPIPKTDPG